MLEKAIKGDQKYWGWLIFLLVLMGIGFACYLYQCLSTDGDGFYLFQDQPGSLYSAAYLPAACAND